MKRISFLLLFFSFLAIDKALAQPTFTISPPIVCTEEGETVCLQVNVVDFTDIIATKFTIKWDSSVLSNPTVMALNPLVTGLDMSDIVINTTNGYLTFNWSNGLPCQSAQTGVTLVDGSSLFQICFTANGQYGKHTPVKFVSSPMDRYVTRINANCNDIGEFVNDGFICIGTPPLTVQVSSVDGFTDDVVCVDFKVTDFDKIVSFQYAIQWDSSILEYQSATTVGLPNWLSPPSPQNIGTTQVSSGYLNVSWLTLQPEGITLPDGTSILQVCFKVKGTCGHTSPIAIVPNPNGVIEVINSTTGNPNDGTNIGLLAKQGTGTVNCFSPNGITLNIDDKNVCPGETFTVDVKVEDFTGIISLEFGLKWNPQIISLNNITYPSTPTCASFASSVNNMGGAGQIKVDWNSGFGCTKPDGFVLMRLSFTATGGSGASTSIAVVNPIFVDKVNPPVENVGINNNNGLVSICQLTGLSTVAGSANAFPGETVCIPFRVENFDDLTEMQYTIGWEPNILKYIGVEDFNLTNLDMNNFLTTQAIDFGVLGVEWENGSGVTVPDGTEIFNVCFEVIGDPGTCTELSFEELPWAIDIQSETSNGTNVGLVSQPGEVCVDNPLSFFTKIPDVYAAPGGQVCIEFTVQNFTQLTNMDYTINWQSDILQFQSITATGLPNFTASSYDASNATTEGILAINWSSANQFQGTTLPDGTSIFKLCFNVIGNGGECSPVVISDSPTFIDITTAPTGDANLGLTSEAGSVCVSGSLHLVDALITPVQCPSSPLGAIDITISGGSGQYDFSWTGQGVDADEEDQSGLTAGTYFLTVTDVQNPGITMEEAFEVNFAPNALLANAGVDTAFSCGGYILTLNGTATTGENAAYQWVNLIGPGLLSGQVIAGGNTLQPTIIGGTCYSLILTDTTSTCTDRDTVCIDSPVIPVPDAGDSTYITCLQDTVIVDGTLSTFGYDVQWTTNDGSIVPGTEKELEAHVTKQGWYYLTLTDLNSGCMRTDSVFVTENKVLPTAAAAPAGDGALGCTDAFEVLDGAGSSTGSSILYAWSPMSGGQICGDTSSLTMQACSPGTFQLTVTDTTNGCFSTATAEITGDTLKPVANAGTFQTLTCEHPTVTLDGSGSSGSANLSYEWTTTNGGIVSPDPNQVSIEADKAGLYKLTVTNDDNGCSAVSEVTVISQQDKPDAAAAVSGEITCDLTSVTLDGEGSSTGTEFIYEWSNPAGVDIAVDLTTEVSEAGTYTLTVTNTLTGCSKTAEIEVVADNIPPVANAGSQKTLTCVVEEVQLEGSADVSGANIIFQWQTATLGCIEDGTTPTPTVKCTGTYILTVANTATGCFDTAHVQVIDDKTAPPVSIALPDEVNCSNPSVQLQGITDATNFSAQWTATPASLVIDDPTSLTPKVHAAGTYFLQITNEDNGCTASAFVAVTADTTAPVADAGDDKIIDCTTPLGTLSAENSTLNGTTITWSAVAPATIDPLIVNDVTISVGVGTYILTVQYDANGCTATDEAVVSNGTSTINAVAGADQNIGCLDNDATLDGTGSSEGAGITYQWSFNGEIVGGNELTITVFEPGTYVLTVSDANSSCTGTDSVEVTQENDGEAATADFTTEPCSDGANLIGNLPNGTTGVWTTGNGAIIADPTAAITSVTGLHSGENVLTWTLTLGNCIDYSSADVTIDLNEGQAAPNANADVESLTPDLLGTLSLNALDNDITGGGDVIFNLLADPSSGSVTSSADGSVTYEKAKCFNGTVEIPYAICSTTCPDLCDTSSIKITVETDPSENCDEVPNGITPNGDGKNDELIFDIIEANPDEFPDNEIVIFNRWGDIVFSAKPYQNDWTGTNKDGKDLPAGTYYYVLKLSVGEGEIIQGDVTILR